MISAAVMFRNDASTLEVALKSIRPHVDQVVCLDTGSTDGSAEIARRYADRVDLYLGCNDPESGLIQDFADARNKSFELADGDVVLWLDADDEVVGGEHIRGIVSQMSTDLEQVMLRYEYAFSDPDEQGNSYCTVEHWRERILRPKRAFEWIGVVHEVCVPRMPLEGGQLNTALSELVKIVHRRHLSTAPREDGRNIRILRKRLKDTGGQDLRALYYLGTELLSAGHAGEGMSLLRRYVDRTDWRSDENCLGCVDIAKAHYALGDYPAAIEWASRAMMIRNFVAPYWELGKSMFALAAADYDPEYNYRRAIYWIEQGLRLTETHGNDVATLQAQNLMERYEIHAFLNVALGRTGNIEGAIRSCQAGLAGLPGNKLLAKNLAAHQDEYARRVVTREAQGLAARGAITENSARVIEYAARGILEGAVVSQPSTATPSGPERALLAERQPDPGKLDLVFFVGPGFEPWSPETLAAGGMGGSETMVWELSKRLAGLGHRVRVYGHCTPTMEGLYENVEWLDHSRFREVSCDVMISSRRPEVVDDEFRLKAGARVLWVHDVHCGQALTYSRDLRFDRVLALSQWHRRHLMDSYPTLNPDKILVTRNGIDLSRFEGDAPRNPHRAVYSSSPDRGLWTALDCWPRVREAVPDAELHVYYGFSNWERTCQLTGDAAALQSLQHLRHLATHTAGVVFHDRVNQRELAREFMRSGVWAYSNWFQETSCLTAMEAQAAGLRMVCSPIAALNETAGERAVMVGRGDREGMQDSAEWRSAEYMQAFTAAVIDAMTLPETEGWAKSAVKPGGWTRDELKAYAREHFDLDTLAADWSRMLGEILGDVRARVVPAFREVAA